MSSACASAPDMAAGPAPPGAAMAAMAAAQQAAPRVPRPLRATVAAGSPAVGGSGISTIMAVSVTGRRRGIGLRMARGGDSLGRCRAAVVALSPGGGRAGVALGPGGAWASGAWATGHWATGHWATGHWATGHWATGHWATGHWAGWRVALRPGAVGGCRGVCPAGNPSGRGTSRSGTLAERRASRPTGGRP